MKPHDVLTEPSPPEGKGREGNKEVEGKTWRDFSSLRRLRNARGGDVMMSRAQGEALATFVNRMRPDWDHPGIVAAIGKAAHLGSPADVAHALLTLAENRELTSPGMLHQQGKHWKRPDGEHTGPNISHNVRCPEHPINFHPCPQCAAKKCPPPQDYLEAKAEALAARPRAAATPTPKTQRTDAESAALARKRLDGETR